MAESRVSDIGSRLRHAREARGLSLRQLADTTKISVRALEAIERNDIAQLPGGIFGRSFVKAYATEVGLDPDAVLRDLLTGAPVETLAIPTSEPSSIDAVVRPEAGDRRIWMLALVIVAVLAVLVAAGYWLYWLQSARRSTPAGPVETISRAAQPARRPSPTRSREPALSQTVSTVPPAAPTAVPASAAAPQVRPLRVELVATGPCWVSATLDGGRTSSRLLASGERVLFEGDREIVLRVGDAGALALTINGLAARPLGTVGQVVTRRITPDTVQELLLQP